MRNIFLALMLLSSDAMTQDAQTYQPLSGKEYEEILDRALPSHSAIGTRKRLIVTLRILPTFGRESQLVIMCEYSPHCLLGRTILISSLNSTVHENFSRGDSKATVMGITPESETALTPVQQDVATALVVALWKAIQLHAAREEGEHKDRDYRTGEVSIALDATTYRISISHGQTYMDLTFLGPDPAADLAGVELSPLVGWSVELTRVVDRELREGLTNPKP